MEILLPSNQSIFYKATKRTLPNPEQAKALSSLQTSMWLLGALRIKSKLLHTTSIQGTSSPGLSSLSGLTFSLSLPSTYPMLFFNLILSSLTANNLHALFAIPFSSNSEFTLQALAYITSSGGAFPANGRWGPASSMSVCFLSLLLSHYNCYNFNFH